MGDPGRHQISSIRHIWRFGDLEIWRHLAADSDTPAEAYQRNSDATEKDTRFQQKTFQTEPAQLTSIKTIRKEHRKTCSEDIPARNRLGQIDTSYQ